jgi:hypothetical protein
VIRINRKTVAASAFVATVVLAIVVVPTKSCGCEAAALLVLHRASDNATAMCGGLIHQNLFGSDRDQVSWQAELCASACEKRGFEHGSARFDLPPPGFRPAASVEIPEICR